MDIPTKGSPASTNFQFWVTNFITITDLTANPPLRRIHVDCVWSFRGTQLLTNSIETCRAPDQ